MKIGDIVTVISKEEYDKRNVNGYISKDGDCHHFTPEHSKFCSVRNYITMKHKDGRLEVFGLDNELGWYSWMFKEYIDKPNIQKFIKTVQQQIDYLEEYIENYGDKDLQNTDIIKYLSDCEELRELKQKKIDLNKLV